MKNLKLIELTTSEAKKINGGFAWPAIVGGVVGAVAAGAYLYEFGYNMVDKAFARQKR
jgi:hypothetical protein